MLHHRQKRIGTMALVGAALAALLGAAPARAQEPPLFVDCGYAAAFRSVRSTQPATIEFVNEIRGVAIVISWIDFQGHAQTRGTLPPGQSVVVQTFVTHPWTATTDNGICLGVYFPKEEPTRMVFRPEELVSQGCGLDPTVRSVPSTTPTTIEFVNETLLSTLVVLWIDFEGRLLPYATLKLGQSIVQPTFLNHRWVVTTLTGACVGIYQSIQRPGRVRVRAVPRE